MLSRMLPVLFTDGLPPSYPGQLRKKGSKPGVIGPRPCATAFLAWRKTRLLSPCSPSPYL